MIFAANRCRERSPNIYVADSLSEIADILNPRLGDVAMLISGDAFDVWRLQESTETADGLGVIDSNACDYKWIRNAASVINIGTFAEGDGTTDDTESLNLAYSALPSGGGIVYYPSGTYKITDNIGAFERSNVAHIGMGAKIVQHTAGKDGFGNYTNSVVRRNLVVGIQVNCAANVIGLSGFYLRNVAESTLFMVKTSMESNFNTDGFRYGIKMWGEAAIGGPWYNDIIQPSILTHRNASSIGIDSDADTNGFAANSCLVEGGSVQALGGLGIHIDKCNNFFALGVKCEGANLNIGDGARIRSTLGGNAIIGCRFEDLNVNIILSANADGNVVAFNNHNSAATAEIQNFATPRANMILEPQVPQYNELRLANLDVFGPITSGLVDHVVFRGGVVTNRYWDVIAKGFNGVTNGYDLEITNPTFKGDLRFTITNGGLVRSDTLAPGTSGGALVMQDGFVRFQRAAAGSAIWTGYTSGENNSRVSVFNDGEHRFSDGTNADDVGFIRLSAGVLKITDAGVGLGVLRAGGLSVTLQSFANNGAALAGGLVANDFYQVTGTDPRQVAVVF